jgi:hypothetical protein
MDTLLVFNKVMRYSGLYHTGQFKQKVTLLHVYNEVTSEPTITRYTIVGKLPKFVCN